MRLVCPSCGAVASAEAWGTDDAARKTLAILVELPLGLGPRALRYLGLFRRPDSPRGLAWSRSLTVATELRELVLAQDIQWDRRRILPNRPGYWATALDATLARDASGELRRPLDSHNYLRAVAYGEADKGAEDAARKREQDASRRTSRDQAPAAPPQEAGDAAQNRHQVKDILAKLGQGKRIEP